MNVPINSPSMRVTLPGWRGSRRRHRSFLVCVLVPTLLIYLYLAFFAQSQYTAEFRFAVYSQSNGGVGNATNSTEPAAVSLVSSPAIRYSHVVTDYLRSRQVIEDLKKRFNLAGLYKGKGFDPVFHFWWDNGSVEALLRYWRNFVLDTSFDITTGIGSVSVRAFAPQDALRLSQALVEQSEQMVNDLSSRPRWDAVRFAQASLERAEKSLDEMLKKEEEFRYNNRIVDTHRDADAISDLAKETRQNLAGMRAQLTTLQARLAANAPALVTLRAQIAAGEQELDRIRAGMREAVDGPAAERSPSLSAAMQQYEYIQNRRVFAMSLRDTMQRNYEQALFDAQVQHEYMQIHVHPSLPQSASVPRPLLWSAISFIALFVFWLTGLLLVASLRDHSV